MKRNLIIGLMIVLAVATLVYAQTINKQIYGIATPGLYKYTLSTNTTGAYLLSVPTLSTDDTIVGLAATQTLTNKTISTPSLSTVTVSDLTASKPVFTDASKILTSSGTMPVNQGGTGLTSYTIGDILYASASTTIAKLAAVEVGQVLVSAGTGTAPAWSGSPSLTTPTLTTPVVNFGAGSHSYAGGTSDWTLSGAELSYIYFKLTSASGGVNMIAPNNAGHMILVWNSTGQTVTCKKSGGTGEAVASTKKATFIHNGSDYVNALGDQ